MNKVIQYFGYFLAGLFIIKMGYSVINAAKKSIKSFVSENTEVSSFNQNIETNTASVNQGVEDIESFSDSPLNKQSLRSSDSLSEIENKIDFANADEKPSLEQEFANESATEEEFESSLSTFASGESGWSEDLSSIIESIV